MKSILRIAKLELNILFYSPIAWFLLVIFLFQCGITFNSLLQILVTYQSLQGPHAVPFMTDWLFLSSGNGVFTAVGNRLYLYIPLLTMGIISKETSSGTIKLLYSSPLKVREIVAGKFAAMMTYNLLLTGLVGLFTLFSVLIIGSADTGQLLSGLLGLYLLLCAYAAIGLFMSCLTMYQVVAAISTLFLLALLNYVGKLWQDIDFVRDLTWFLSISGRATKMYAGLVTTKDIFYFVVIIFMFLGFAICKLRADRESRPFRVRAGRYVIVLVSALLIGYVSSRPSLTGYYDATATKTHTLTASAQRIIKAADSSPLEVVSYINLLDFYYSSGKPDQRNMDMARWEPFVRFKPDISFRYVYYYDSIPYAGMYKKGRSLKQMAEKMAKDYHVDLADFATPAEIRKIIDLRPEANKYVMQLKYNGRQTFLRLFDDKMRFPGETEISAALKRLMVPPPRIALVYDDLERSAFSVNERDYGVLTSSKSFRYALINQGFDVDSLSLKTGEIPRGLAAVVISDPRTALDSAAIGKLRRYIDEGGNLLIAGEPGKQGVINPLLAYLGVKLMDGELVQQTRDLAANVVLAKPAGTAATEIVHAMKRTMERKYPISMVSAAPLSYASNGPFTVRPLLVSDQSGWLTKQRLTLDSAEIRYSEAGGDVRGAFPVALCLTRSVHGREQRIAVLGDADFMSNAELNRWNVTTGNFSFSTALFGWFTYGAFPIDSSRPPAKDDHLKLTDDDMDYMRILFNWLLPGLFLVGGTVLLLRRKRR